jgi:hypothetical protein
VFSFDNRNDRTLVPLPDICVDGLQDPRDIVACHRTRRLFIADGFGRCIWIVRPEDGSIIDRIREVAPYSLSTTRDVAGDCLLVVTPSDGHLTVVQLPVDCPDEPRRRRAMETMRNLNYWHAVMTSGGSLIVCHRGRRLADVEHGQLTEIDERQQRVVRRFGGRSAPASSSSSSSSLAHALESSTLGAFSPVYAVIDDDSDGNHLFVADLIGNRVLLLDSQMRLERVLLSADDNGDLYRPTRLCYVRSNGRLIVAQEDDDRIYVYALRK